MARIAEIMSMALVGLMVGSVSAAWGASDGDVITRADSPDGSKTAILRTLTQEVSDAADARALCEVHVVPPSGDIVDNGSRVLSVDKTTLLDMMWSQNNVLNISVAKARLYHVTQF